MNENTEPEVAVCYCRTIPISHLSLDGAEPIIGWTAFFVFWGSKPTLRLRVMQETFAVGCTGRLPVGRRASESAFPRRDPATLPNRRRRTVGLPIICGRRPGHSLRF